ncbi:hypothetical protein CPB84DRAFT_1958637 [Gymnopilus junonius]|uniref:ZZ-type domain-containing protein n=1 Tax=Gymnopilus junonius TaxID=109634 RepID=A0A9P5NZY1_GYMJU|nr:hypothetical protein CPB84DRAFT_1958637 [Gymnopilus junonius]
MFTIKVVFCGQIRKLTFSNNTFPAFTEICDQLNRVFSVPSGFYFSKLLFSPDASQPSRVLIGKEVHNAYDYAKCIRPFKNRTWPNALLRFTVCDPTSGATPSVRSINSSQVPQTSVFNHHDVSMSHQSSQSFSFSSSIPTALQTPMEVDVASVTTVSNQTTPKIPAQANTPTAQHEGSSSVTGSCCSVSQGKAEIKAMLTEFKDVLDRVVNNDLATPQQGNASAIHVTEAPPPSLCSVCTRSAAGAPNGVASWYSCESCHVVVCADCHSKERPGFCLSLMGPHKMKPVSTTLGEDSGLPIPHLPTPWTPRPLQDVSASLNPPFTSGASSMSGNSKPVDRAHGQDAAAAPSVPVVHTAIHRGVVCDSCNATIIGIRHKCLDCPNYDLCTPCMSVGCAEAHNPFHEFFDITEPGRVVVHNVFSGNGERETARQHRRASTSVTAAPTVHLATCDLCDSRILGDRYKCINCPDFDTCESCYIITGEQHPKHAFVRIHKQEDYVRPHSAPRQMHYATCDGCSKRIYGARFKCMHPECPDYDLCENCEALPIAVHPENHPMLKMKASDTVIPTVYRVGQKSLIPETQRGVSTENQPPRRSTTPLPPRQDSPLPFIGTAFGERVQTPTPNVRIAPEVVSPPPVVNPLLAVLTPTSPVRPPPLPPKPEMMSHPSWASIPGFFYPSQWDAEPLPSISVEPPVLEDDYRASLRNPFTDIEENQEQSEHAPSPVISLPSVPSHTPNPWPTTNSTERQELLQLIADFAGPSTSPNVLNALSESTSNEMRSIEDKWVTFLRPTALNPTVPPPPPSRPPLNCTLPVNPYLQAGPIVQAAPSSEDATKAVAESKVTLSPDDRVNAGFDKFSMPHLLEVHEQHVAVLEDETRAVPSIAGSISGEALLRRPSPDTLTSSLSSQRSLAELIRDVPSPVATKEVNEELPETRVPLSASFIEDVTVLDGQIFPPGAEFMKCWRLLNNGSRDWPESTELVFVAGESLSTEKASPAPVVLGKVAAGADIEVWTGELKAPDAPGPYVGYWRLKADGEVFGDSLWIEINVVEADSHSSSESMASSSVIMPGVSSAPQSQHVASTTVRTNSVPTDLTSTDDNMSDAGSDVSLISMPSSPSVSDDDAMWHDTRSHATTELGGAAASGAPAQPSNSSAIDYVLLYDDSSSSEE